MHHGGAAAALVVASAAKAHALGLAPLARILSFATVGVEPKVMGIGVARLIDSDQHEPEAGDPGGRHRAADRGGSTKALAADIRRCFWRISRSLCGGTER